MIFSPTQKARLLRIGFNRFRVFKHDEYLRMIHGSQKQGLEIIAAKVERVGGHVRIKDDRSSHGGNWLFVRSDMASGTYFYGFEGFEKLYGVIYPYSMESQREEALGGRREGE